MKSQVFKTSETFPAARVAAAGEAELLTAAARWYRHELADHLARSCTKASKKVASNGDVTFTFSVAALPKTGLIEMQAEMAIERIRMLEQVNGLVRGRQQHCDQKMAGPARPAVRAELDEIEKLITVLLEDERNALHVLKKAIADVVE